ncbi:glycosyl transferase [Bacillus toyonensis]|uniref:glycosyltransferase n=1 Tax=Bacillus cereus group TaxID=86661 RepID=UPI000BEBB3B2|nr:MULTISPECIES: glycosyltransferase [Bacillus cereus group]MCG3796857.1 glycosyltransferase [Bacillus toyonensis]MED2617348.1 glycosyltransferase [Bacillus toyonensis]PED94597.1 glycosyl transferase [Bacillus toyonensis]
MHVNKKIIYVSHDAHFHGAQLLSLHTIKALKENFDYSVAIISIGSGILIPDFQKYGPVYCLEEDYPTEETVELLIKTLLSQDYTIAICSTVISGDMVALLARHNIKVISLIHELPHLIQQYSAEGKARNIAESAYKIVFPSQYVYEKFLTITQLDHQKCHILPQGLFNHNPYKNNITVARNELRKKLNLPLDSKIVLGVGFADYRKGIDLFSFIAYSVRKVHTNIHFIWVGRTDVHLMDTLSPRYKAHFTLVDPTPDIGLYNAGADLYLLTSREDPFPNVVLEALDTKVPVIGFKNAGGFEDVVTEKTGALVDFLNLPKMVERIYELIGDEELRLQKGSFGQELIEKNFNFLNYIYQLLALLEHNYKKISVIVPNYNYEHYLPDRVRSILNQTYPLYELIFLDDASTDNSVSTFEKLLSKENKPHLKVQRIINEKNSGSVFKQWIKGISKATGDYIWIAESDDLCEKTFLQEVIHGFHINNKVTLSYTQSKQIDEQGNVIADHYLNYTNDIDKEKWKTPYFRKGIDEIQDTLLIKNTIPNVSSVVFKNIDIKNTEKQLAKFKIAGDWFFYVSILQEGHIHFNPKSLNYHRRHTNSVTKTEDSYSHYNEVVQMQNFIKKNFTIDDISKMKMYTYRKYLKTYLNI